LAEATAEKRERERERDKDETIREVEREVKWRDVKPDESSARDNKSMTETVPPKYSDARSQLSWDRLVGGSFPPGEGEDVSPAPRQIAHPSALYSRRHPALSSSLVRFHCAITRLRHR